MRYSQEAGGVSRPAFSFVDVDTGNGYGTSPNVYIRKFSELRDKSGYAIAYVSDPVKGDSFRIQEAGIYSVQYTDADNSGTTAFGISLNADTTVDISNLPIARRTNGRAGRLAEIQTASGLEVQVCWTGPLYPGDIIRAHTNNGTTSTTIRIRFIICKISTI